MSSKWQDVGMCYEQAVLVHLRVSLIYIYVYLCIICIMAAGSLDGKKITMARTIIYKTMRQNCAKLL